ILALGGDSANNQNDASLGTGAVTISNAQLRFGGNAGATVNHFISNAITLNGNAVLGSIDGDQYLQGGVAINGTGNLAFTRWGGKDLIFNSAVSGSGALAIDDETAGGGSGAVRFTTANTYSGTLTVNGPSAGRAGGLLSVEHNQALQNATVNTTSGMGGVVFSTGTTAPIFGALAGNGSFALQDGAAAAITLSAGGNNSSTTYSGALSGPGALTKVGAGTMTLGGASSNTYTGATAVNDGTLLLSKSAGLNAIAGTTVNIGDGVGAAGSAVLQLGTSNQIINTANLTIVSDGLFDLNGQSETVNSVTGTATNAAGAVDTGGGALTINGTLDVESGASAGTFTVIGGGSLNLAGSSTAVFDIYSAASYDFVSRTGTAVTADGVIDVNLDAGYDPIHGTTYDLFQNGTVSGTPTFDFTGAARAGLVWDTSDFATTNGRITALGVAGNIWDTNNTTSGATDTDPTAPGNWSDAFWSSDPSGTGTYVTGLFNDGSMPVFSAGTDASGTFSVNVDGGTHNVAGILVEEGNVTLADGGGVLNLTSGGIDVNTGLAGSLTINAQLTGSVGLTKNGANSTLTLGNTGNNYTGNTLVSAGTLRLGASNVLPNTTNLEVASTGTFNMNGFDETVVSLTVQNNGTVNGLPGDVLTLSSTGNALTLNDGADLPDADVQINLTGAGGSTVLVQGTGGV
ncbi:MAG: autotransporter-associated beta strand repeat-containing protein, partial [Planctomycetales bacterium]|nr:autotransporter-associated beta strand repeat-containing protein [Planctomycetales bacterium]